MRHRILAATLAAALAVTLTACGGDDDADGDADGATASTGPTADGGGPERIISLSPSTTETLFAIGAGDQVVAVDDQSNYPEDAPTTALSGFEPNVEAIVGYEPDLVIMDSDAIADELDRVGVELLVAPAPGTLDDLYTQIGEIGDATGHADGAAALVDEMRAEIDEITATVPDGAEPLSYYHELDDLYYTVTSSSFIGQIYALAGLENIADAADDGTGYPQLSGEFIVQADPDLIFLADTKCCGQSAATIAARDGWATLTAVGAGNVVELDDDIASRWGPRVVDLLRVIVDAAGAAREAA